jgi:hypothetical protein
MSVRRFVRAPLLVLVVLVAGGCGLLDDPPALDEFVFEESEHGTTIEPAIDVAAITNSIAIVGQHNTPTPCHRLVAEFDHSGSRLILTITATRTSTTCEAIVGSFRYQGVIRFVEDGNYDFVVRHVFPGSSWMPQEFSVAVNVR